MSKGRALVALALILAACSGDDDAADPVASDAPNAAEAAPTVTEVPVASTTAPPPTADTTPTELTAAPSTPPAETAVATAPTEPPTVPTTAGSSAPPEPAPNEYPAQPAGVPFPTTEWPVGELPADVDRGAIDAAVDRGFGAPDAAPRVRSVVVVQGGRIVYERYHPLDGPDVPFNSFSVAKSFTSAMIGQLVADGRLALDAPPPVAEWQAQGDPRQAITLRELLQMSSGLNWAEEYVAGSLPAQMLQAQDAAAVAANQPLESEPGSTFEYSTGTTALLAGIAADVLGGCAELDAFVQQRLLDPIGITTDTLLKDGNGCWLGGLGADMTTRDFARFGLLYLRGGSWDGATILPASWVDESRVPAATNPDYGLQWWLAPDGSFSAEGLFGQRIVVVPEADLVVATNTTRGGDSFTMVDAIRAALGS